MGSHATDSHQPAYTAEEALLRLQEGNARFVSGHARFPTVQKEVLAELAKGQRPYATVLGCSDSRVPPELVFYAAFGFWSSATCHLDPMCEASRPRRVVAAPQADQ
jgi:hypothetical protein